VPPESGETPPAPPATLPVGKTEMGFWSASAGEVPEIPPHATSGQISFPIPLAAPLTEVHVHYMTAPVTAELETNPSKTILGCKTSKTETIHPLEKPVAESGNLCVYTGFQELGDARFLAIINTSNAPGASRFGADLYFEVETPEPVEEMKIQVLGTWAVKG
jgi:hypothetical protein